MHSLLGAPVARVRDDRLAFQAGDEDADVLEHLPVRFGAVDPLYRIEMLTWAHWAACRARPSRPFSSCCPTVTAGGPAIRRTPDRRSRSSTTRRPERSG
jgi:hypothetical protein